ncbi:hypothetical protein T459_05658 [Capsicum annuum]|uniref:RING-type domain-containing protein n=1 Tax=Capsicum annuum TaxID=4072 RepID=A0A2G3A8G7_CAPAN|nr:hypothetical protein T459_05658 [Capsicum annuum]
MLITQSTSRSTHSTVQASSPVIQSDCNTSGLHIPGETEISVVTFLLAFPLVYLEAFAIHLGLLDDHSLFCMVNIVVWTWASDFPREYNRACLQIRMSYSPAAHLFLFLVQWTDCHLAGALGLLRILIYKVDGTRTMSVQERKASIREFYGEFLHFPSFDTFIGVMDSEDKKQKAVCMERYWRRDDEDYRQSSDSDIEREEECGICMEMNRKIVLPKCNHALCLKYHREWYV